MKKKEIKNIKQKLVKSVKKVLSANNKNLITTLEKDLEKSFKVVETEKNRRKIAMKRAAEAEA